MSGVDMPKTHLKRELYTHLHPHIEFCLFIQDCEYNILLHNHGIVFSMMNVYN